MLGKLVVFQREPRRTRQVFARGGEDWQLFVLLEVRGSTPQIVCKGSLDGADVVQAATNIRWD